MTFPHPREFIQEELTNIEALLLSEYGRTVDSLITLPAFDGQFLIQDYDGFSGWKNYAVNGTSDKVYTIFLTGTTEAAADVTTVAHGVSTTIVGVQTIIDGYVGADGTEIVSVTVGAANVEMTYAVGHRNKAYKIRIDALDA